ncbi:hypothetical protein C8T65DRAFT_746630 [Cerioporus squamosus]|nr:hypothetical protein C8T65DRAFT_746630 [Cerioporus squamosus]
MSSAPADPNILLEPHANQASIKGEAMVQDTAEVAQDTLTTPVTPARPDAQKEATSDLDLGSVTFEPNSSVLAIPIPADTATPEKIPARASAATSAEEGKDRAAPAPPLPLLIPAVPSASLATSLGCARTADHVAGSIILILRSDILVVGHVVDSLQLTVTDLKDSFYTLKAAATEQVARTDTLSALATTQKEALKAFRYELTLVSGGAEQHEEDTSKELTYFHQRMDTLSDTIEAISQSLSTVTATVTQLSRDVQGLQALHAAAQPASLPASDPAQSVQPAPGFGLGGGMGHAGRYDTYRAD